eukprot:sb/3465501/
MAITRAQDWLCVVGDPYTLCNVGPNRFVFWGRTTEFRSCWDKLIRYCIDMRSFHFNSADQFIASLSKPSASKLPSISHVSSNTSEPLSDYSEKERKQFFKQKLLPIVKKMCPQYAEKVTTVLIEMDTKRMIELFADESELQWKIKKTIEFLGCLGTDTISHFPELQEQREHPMLRHLTEQVRALEDHERLIKNLYLHVQNNGQATHILQEQMFILKDQRQRCEKQAQLALHFLSIVTPQQHKPLGDPPRGAGLPSLVNGNGPSPPSTFGSGGGSMLGFNPPPPPPHQLQLSQQHQQQHSLPSLTSPFATPSPVPPPGWGGASAGFGGGASANSGFGSGGGGGFGSSSGPFGSAPNSFGSVPNSFSSINNFRTLTTTYITTTRPPETNTPSI